MCAKIQILFKIQNVTRSEKRGTFTIYLISTLFLLLNNLSSRNCSIF